MSEMFPVQAESPQIPVAGDRPVVFHGVNKSGSLAMSDVIREAYYAAGRANQFFSTYHGIPRPFEDFARILSCSNTHAFYVSHYLYRAFELPRGAVLVSQVRHPLPRTLSVHGWLKRNHLKRHGTLEGFPALRDYVLASNGRAHTQWSQFIFGYAPDRKEKMKAIKLGEMFELALENFERDIAWHGIAELFEESIFAMARVCGLESVPPWQKDTRNRWREPLADIDDELVQLIYETYPLEFEFYEHALRTFRERVSRIDFGPSLAAYKERCSGEYGDRLVTSLVGGEGDAGRGRSEPPPSAPATARWRVVAKERPRPPTGRGARLRGEL